jgi:drug/metabolite transporter (DMT)-like permease
MKSRGVLYMTLSAFGFSIMAVLVKLVSPRLPTGEIVFMRAAMTLALSYLMVRRAGLSPWGIDRSRLVMRGFLGFLGLATYYLAIVRLPLADAVTLQYISPLITSLLAWWLLGERLGWAGAVAIGCGVGGVLLVVHPGIPLGGGADLFGVACGVGSALSSALAYVTVRQLSRTEHPLVIVFYFPLVAVPLALPWLLYDVVLPSALDWLLLIGIGVSSQVGQVFLTRSLAVERAGRATAVGYVQICFAVMWQILVFAKWPALGTVLGAALVIAGTLAVSMTRASAAEAGRTPT